MVPCKTPIFPLLLIDLHSKFLFRHPKLSALYDHARVQLTRHSKQELERIEGNLNGNYKHRSQVLYYSPNLSLCEIFCIPIEILAQLSSLNSALWHGNDWKRHHVRKALSRSRIVLVSGSTCRDSFFQPLSLSLIPSQKKTKFFHKQQGNEQ